MRRTTKELPAAQAAAFTAATRERLSSMAVPAQAVASAGGWRPRGPAHHPGPQQAMDHSTVAARLQAELATARAEIRLLRTSAQLAAAGTPPVASAAAPSSISSRSGPLRCAPSAPH